MKKFILIAAVLIVVGGVIGSRYYQDIYGDNVVFERSPAILLIADGDGYEQVLAKLEALQVLKSIDGFDRVAQLKSYPDLVKPGRYIIEDGMSNDRLINRLRIGEQTAVKLTFNNLRTLPDLAGRVAQQIQADSLQMLHALTNDSIRMHYGFSKRTYPSMFLPDTYEFYWTDTPERFIQRMAKEFKRFWTDERLAKARRLGLTQSEVVTLASIVQEEQTLRPDEHKRIAGLYINRVRRGMPLQSDPTVKFAVGDMSIKRVLNVHLKADSPYNTYKYPGLPPGPINMPSKRAIDAVLDYEQHDYIFMCAKADRSGYHHFSRHLREHNRYAREFQQSLDERKIFR